MRTEASFDATLDGVSSETLALLFGGTSPASTGAEQSMTLKVRDRVIPYPLAPSKRRGLTGKRYRIARRQYARQVRACRRGDVDLVEVERLYFFPSVTMATVAEPGPGTLALAATIHCKGA